MVQDEEEEEEGDGRWSYARIRPHTTTPCVFDKLSKHHERRCLSACLSVCRLLFCPDAWFSSLCQCSWSE